MAAEHEQAARGRRLNLTEVREAEAEAGETIGLQLRALRLARGESLAQVSTALRIRRDLIEAIETGRHELLPGKAYAIGFVRSYAEHLKADSADFVRRYKAELESDTQSYNFDIPVTPPPPERMSTTVVALILLLVAIGLAGGWFVADQSGLLRRNPPLTPQTATPAAEPPAAPQTAPAPAAPAAPVEAVAPPAPAPAPGTPPPALASADPLPPPAPPSALTPPKPGDTAEAASGRVFGQQNRDARIVFVARRPVQLTVRSPGSDAILINRRLSQGQSYRVNPNLTDQTLSTDDAGALDVLLDGAYAGRLGADGAELKDAPVNPAAYGAPDAPPASPPANP